MGPTGTNVLPVITLLVDNISIETQEGCDLGP